MRSLGAVLAKRRTFGRITHFGGFRGVFYWDKGLEVLKRGVVERVIGVVDDGVLRRAPAPEPLAFAALAQFRSAVLRSCKRVPRWSRADYTSSFSGSQLAIYREAALSLELVPLQLRDYRTTIFPKAEKTRKAPRAIIFRGPRFNVELGRYLKAVEHHIYRAIARVYGYDVVMKGRNLDQRAAAICAAVDAVGGQWVAVMLDASKFDAHISVDALRYEHSFYEALFPRDSELQGLLKAQLSLHADGRCPDGGLTVKKPGNRCSGDVNTSLGNVIIMCALMHGFMQGLPGSRLVNDGDDSVLILPRALLGDVRRSVGPYFARFGFTMRVDGVADVLEQVVFCQSQPVYNGERYTMVRSPAKAIGQDLCSTRIVTLADARRHMAAVGVCGGALSRGLPVLQEFYAANRMVGSSIGNYLRDPSIRREGFAYYARNVSLHGELLRPITDAARFSYALAFGTLPSRQLALERHFAARAILPLSNLLDYTINPVLYPYAPVVLPVDDHSWVFYTLNSERSV